MPSYDEVFSPEGVELPSLDGAKNLALATAFSFLESAIRAGRLRPGGRIDVKDDAGVIVHTVYFRDLVERPRLAKLS